MLATPHSVSAPEQPMLGHGSHQTCMVGLPLASPCREGNAWSHHYCRRQWSLADNDHLRYKHLLAWDAAMQQLEERFCFQQSSHQLVSFIGTSSEQVWQCRDWHTVCMQPLLLTAHAAACMTDCLHAGNRRLVAKCHDGQACSTGLCGAMIALLSSTATMLQVIVAERGALVFVFNFSPFHSFEGYKVSQKAPCLWRCSRAAHPWSA